MGGRLGTTQALTLDDIGVEVERGNDWNDEGVIHLPGFFHTAYGEQAMEHYRAAWRSEHLRPGEEPTWGGWPYPTPYMQRPEILDLFAPLGRLFLDAPFHEPYGMHLNLTGWVTTQRDWHQDSYLNPRFVGDRYAAAWVALDDIDPDSGPFQYVPGSHRWPQVTREMCWRTMENAGLTVDQRTWPTESEQVLSPLFEREIARRDAEVVSYVPKRGDLLLWHGRLLHRGSKAKVPDARRPAIITHLSACTARPDMPSPKQWRDGNSWYFPLDAR